MRKETTRYFSVVEVAALLGCTVGAVRKWIRRGQLRAVYAGRLVRVTEEDLQAFLKQPKAAQ